MKLNILIYDAGLGGDFLFNALVQSSNLKHKSKYIAYPQENNKWYCFDAFVMLFNTSYVPGLLNEYFDLKLFADIETGINQKTLANITNDELIKLLNFTSKIWFYNMKKLGFPQKQMQLWEIPTTTKVKEIDNLPDILYNLDEPFYTKGHWYSKLPNQTIIKLAWPKSKRSVLKNIWENYQNQLFIITAQEQNVITTQNNFDRTEERYKLGQVISVEFRQAQINLVNSKTALNNARFDAKLIQLQLLQLSGDILNVKL